MFSWPVAPAAFAQSQTAEFITPVPEAKNTLKDALKTKADKLEKWDKAKKVQYVKLGNLAKIQKAGVLDFTIPGIAKRFKARASHVDAQSDKEYHWVGELADTTGSVSILAKDGQITGRIDVENRVFEIYALGENLQALVEVDMTQFTSSECAVNTTAASTSAPAPEPGQAALPTTDSGRSDNSAARLGVCAAGPIRVLMLFTPAAAAATDINERINFCLTQANDAFRQSGTNMQIQEAGRQQLNFREDRLNIDDDVERLATDAAVATLRNQTAADIVILLTEGNYTLGLGGGRIFGIVRDPELRVQADQAFAIVEAQEATSLYTFSHEMAHLFGARHQRCAVFDTGGCATDLGTAHGFPFRTGIFNQQHWITIVHQLRDGWTRRLYYSNPDIKVQDKTIGSASDNNARQIRNMQATVANFRPSVQGFNVSISGPNYLPLYQSGTWEAIYSCGTGTYTFEWSVSTDGFNYSFAGNGETTGGGFYTCNEYKYLRLTVRSSTGQVASASFTAFTESCGSANRVATIAKATAPPQPGATTLKDAYPNPFSSTSQIEFYLPESGAVKLDLINAMGGTVKVLAEKIYPAGWHQQEFNAGTLPGGVYYYRLRTGKNALTKTLILIK